MALFQLIIWIAIIYYIVQKVKKQSGEGTQQNRQAQNSPNQNRSIYNRPVQNTTSRNNPPQTYNKNFAVMPEQKKIPPNVERDCIVEDGHRSETNGSASPTAKSSATPNVQRGYTEAPKQTRAERKGTRMVAMRLYEGDHVPQGYRMVKCSYCAAENLIAYSSRADYMCYFCHADLK